MTTGRDEEFPVDEIARAWLTKMRGEDAAAVREEFEAWLESSPLHREAYDRIQRRVAASAILKASARHGTAHAASRRRRWPGWAWGAAATAAALLMAAFGAGGVPLPGRLSADSSAARAAEPLVTRHGEIRTFRLRDGSRATLDTDSRAEVRLVGQERRFRLTKGRARLSVGRRDTPMDIEAGHAAMSVEAGEIDVGLSGAGIATVILRSGEASLHTDGNRKTPLPHRQSVAVRSDGTGQPAAISTDQIPDDWPLGWAEYRLVRLDHLVAEANRYAETPIVIDDRSLAGLELSGRFHVSQTDAFVERVSQVLHLSVEKRPGSLHLRRR